MHSSRNWRLVLNSFLMCKRNDVVCVRVCVWIAKGKIQWEKQLIPVQGRRWLIGFRLHWQFDRWELRPQQQELVWLNNNSSCCCCWSAACCCCSGGKGWWRWVTSISSSAGHPPPPPPPLAPVHLFCCCCCCCSCIRLCTVRVTVHWTQSFAFVAATEGRKKKKPTAANDNQHRAKALHSFLAHLFFYYYYSLFSLKFVHTLNRIEKLNRFNIQ